MGCWLGWHFTVGWLLRGSRVEYKQYGLLFHKKQLREKKMFGFSVLPLSPFLCLGSLDGLPPCWPVKVPDPPDRSIFLDCLYAWLTLFSRGADCKQLLLISPCLDSQQPALIVLSCIVIVAVCCRGNIYILFYSILFYSLMSGQLYDVCLPVWCLCTCIMSTYLYDICLPVWHLPTRVIFACLYYGFLSV
jgi:hypothetical protein